MRIRTTWILSLIVVAVFGSGVWFACRADEPTNRVRDVKPFMRMKLEASSRILEGLTTENFEMIAEGARKLRQMSTAEKWRVTNDVLYRQYSAEFADNAGKLLEKAKAHNLDGATLAWVECTMSCVRCHNHARAIKIVSH
jgi:cytochrome c556